MKKKDKVPSSKSGEGEREDPLMPQPDPLPDSPDTGAENDVPNSEDETGRTEEDSSEKSSVETELPAEPEPLVEPKPLVEPGPTTPSPQKKKISGKIILVLFLGFLLTGLSATVYFLVEERSKTFLEIQKKLARLDSKLGAIQTGPKDSGQTARDLASLQQEFQTFREQVAESLASQQTPVAKPPTPTEEPGEIEEQETTTHSDEVASQIDQAPTEPHHDPEPTHNSEPHHDSEPAHDLEVAPDHESVPLEEDTGSSEPSHDEVALEHPQPIQPLSSHKPAHEPEELPGEQVERSAEVQQYINFVESTAEKLFGLVKKGSNTAWDYLVDLLG